MISEVKLKVKSWKFKVESYWAISIYPDALDFSSLSCLPCLHAFGR